MPIKDLLRPEQLAALRRLRKRIVNRTAMRRYRADPLYLQAAVRRRRPAARIRHLRPSPEPLERRALLPLLAAPPVAAEPRDDAVRDRRRGHARRRHRARRRRPRARRRPAHRRHRAPAGRRRRHARTHRPVPFSMTFAPMIAWRSGTPPGATDRRPVPSSTCRGFVPRRPSH